MANWWDDFTTQAGDSLIGMQLPFGMAPPTDPAERARMISPMLMQMGAGILAGKDRNPAVNIGRGVMAAQQFGADQMGRNLYAAQIMQSQAEKKAEKERENKTLQMFRQNYPELYAKYGDVDGKQAYELMVAANRPPDHSAAFTQYQEAQADPQFAQFLQQSKGASEKPRTQKAQVNGHDVLMNLDTGEIMKDYGPTQSRAQTVPGAVQTDLIKAKQAYGTVNAALDRFEKAATAAGTWGATVPGAQKDAVSEERRNVQLMLKEMYNLGVLNGPDLELMDTMLFDPSLSALDPVGSISKMAGGTGQRVSASVARMKQRLKEMVESKIAVVKASSAAPSGSDSMSVEPPADVDPALWEAMTPEEQALWQTSQ